MKEQIPLPGGELEHSVMNVLWECQTATAREIYDRVGAPNHLVYTTIAKVLDRLHEKGLVSRRTVKGAFIYKPKIERELVERSLAVNSLGRLLGDKPVPAIATLVAAVEEIDSDLLDELARVVEARRKSRGS